MKKKWNNARDVWEIVVDDPNDHALARFEFPPAAHHWLSSPSRCLRSLEPAREISAPFFNRLRHFVRDGRVRVSCLVRERKSKPIRHSVILGTDDHPKSIAMPLDNSARPDWSPFPRLSPEFRSVAELVAGSALGGLVSPPLVFPCAVWANWKSVFPCRAGSRENLVPAELTQIDEPMAILQCNFSGVITLLRAPGTLVLADLWGQVRLEDNPSPQEWLVAQLEGRAQPSPESLGRRSKKVATGGGAEGP
ncbi:MAG: hypothetical protein GY716_08120 [bacterium]|nr:hypothetical protein [bacterium]